MLISCRDIHHFIYVLRTPHVRVTSGHISGFITYAYIFAQGTYAMPIYCTSEGTSACGEVVCLCARSPSTIGFYPALVCTWVAWCLGGLATPTPVTKKEVGVTDADSHCRRRKDAFGIYGVGKVWYILHYAPGNVMPHLTQVGQRWGLVGICKVEQSNAPPLGTTSQHKSPTNPLVLPLARLNNFLRCEYYGVTQYTCMYETNFFCKCPYPGDSFRWQIPYKFDLG